MCSSTVVWISGRSKRSPTGSVQCSSAVNTEQLWGSVGGARVERSRAVGGPVHCEQWTQHSSQQWGASSGRTCAVHSTEKQSSDRTWSRAGVGGLAPGVAAQSCAGSPPSHTSMASSCLILQVDCSPPILTQCYITSVSLKWPPPSILDNFWKVDFWLEDVKRPRIPHLISWATLAVRFSSDTNLAVRHKIEKSPMSVWCLINLIPNPKEFDDRSFSMSTFAEISFCGIEKVIRNWYIYYFPRQLHFEMFAFHNCQALKAFAKNLVRVWSALSDV